MNLRELEWARMIKLLYIYPCHDVDCDVLQAVGGIYEDMGDMNAGAPKVSTGILYIQCNSNIFPLTFFT